MKEREARGSVHVLALSVRDAQLRRRPRRRKDPLIVLVWLWLEATSLRLRHGSAAGERVGIIASARDRGCIFEDPRSFGLARCSLRRRRPSASVGSEITALYTTSSTYGARVCTTAPPLPLLARIAGSRYLMCVVNKSLVRTHAASRAI